MTAISIVSFNTKNLLQDCLNSLKSQDGSSKLNIWVLDNNSSDGSAEMVEKEFPDVNLIRSDINLGFAKGQNQILKKIKDKYVLVLNPDTKIEEKAITEMVRVMENNPECAVLGSKLIDFNGNLESNGGDFPFGLALFSWLFNLESLMLPNFHRTDLNYYKKTHQVDWVSGTFMMTRSNIFEKAGFFNEEFFMYFEDCEFCYRVKKSGFKVMINPGVVVKHKSGSSSKNPRFFQWKSEFEGLIKFYYIYKGFLGVFYLRLLINLAVILRIIAFLITGEFKKSAIYAKVIISI